MIDHMMKPIRDMDSPCIILYIKNLTVYLVVQYDILKKHLHYDIFVEFKNIKSDI